MSKPKVAFVCVHNSCRSQMAEAIAKLNAADVFQAYSAGTHIKDKINQDAIEAIEMLHGVNMNETQTTKMLDAIPDVDIVVTMGCNANCPNIACKHREDWNLDDPSGKDEVAFIKTANTIQSNIDDLVERIQNQTIKLD